MKCLYSENSPKGPVEILSQGCWPMSLIAHRKEMTGLYRKKKKTWLLEMSSICKVSSSRARQNSRSQLSTVKPESLPRSGMWPCRPQPAALIVAKCRQATSGTKKTMRDVFNGQLLTCFKTARPLKKKTAECEIQGWGRKSWKKNAWCTRATIFVIFR